MTSPVEQLKFQELCEVLESIRKVKPLQEKRRILSEFFNKVKLKATETEDKKVSNAILYPILRLLVPEFDRDRGAYGIKEFSLAKKLIKMLSLRPDGPDAACLLNFRATSKNTKVKDFADAAYWILQKYFSKTNNLNVAEINTYLDSLAEKHSTNDPRGIDELLFKLFRATSAAEHTWLIRIILKDMSLGISKESILNVFHPDGAELYSSNGNLQKVCELLRSSSIRLNEIEISLFSAFRPMLSQRCDLKEFLQIAAPKNKIQYFVETKFDGERFQLHMKDNVFKYFSRNGYSHYTDNFGNTYDNGIYTPLLKTAFKDNVNSIILDGEMMGWNTRTKQFGSKGMNFDVKHSRETTVYQPCFCVFDILLFNNEVLSGKPLKERVQYLRKSINPIEGVIMISNIEKASSQTDLIDALNKSMDRGEEGIVFKDPDSQYKANSRNAGWWKMKLEYFEGVMNDLDVLIMGGYYGSGRFRMTIRDYLVGVAVAVPEGESPNTFLSFAKVQTGLSDKEHAILDQKLSPFWKKIGEGDPEEYGLKFGKERPDVWIPPQNSCVLLVRATELIRIHSADFQTNYTLRFPRIKEIRPDKPYYDCLTDGELENLTLNSECLHKLNKRHLELSDLEVLVKKKKRTAALKPKDLSDVEVKNDILRGYEFCVLTGNDENSKEQIEKLVVENGGVIVQNEGNNTFCLLAGHYHPRITFYNQIDHICDVVKLDWLFRVLEAGELKNYGPFDLMSMTSKTKKRLLSEYDQYYDSYTEEATEESLRKSMELIREKGHYVNLMPDETEKLLNELSSVKQKSDRNDTS